MTVTKQVNVGPYATVQLHATDSSALSNWLAQNGYDLSADVAPVIAEYVTEGFDFLAMKLLPNQGVQAMRPVRVTTPGASLSLPLRMAAVGTGPEVGISIWVVADGRYQPQNFPFFHIDDSALVWDFAMNQSNYTTLRVQNEANLMGKGWEIESSISLNEQTITNVILSGGQYYGGGGLGGPVAAPADPTLDYLPIGSADGGAEGGVSETAEEVRTADVNALFAGLTGPNVRVTRIRSDILHTAMTADFVLQASTDQSELVERPQRDPERQPYVPPLQWLPGCRHGHARASRREHRGKLRSIGVGGNGRLGLAWLHQHIWIGLVWVHQHFRLLFGVAWPVGL